MNPNPSVNRDVIELWGREFNLVKNGLSEAQVVSFVNDLAKQHDVLLQRQEHLTALTKLAERTVSEADKLADEIQQDAKNQAKEEAAKLIAEAETAAKTQTKRILSDAEATAKAQTQRILSDAKERVEQTIREKEAHAMAAAAEQAEAIKATAEKLANETKKAADAEAKRVISEAESRGRHIVEQKESEAVASAAERERVILENARQEASTLLEREKQRIQPDLTQFVRNLRTQLMSELDIIKSKVGSLETQFGDTLPDISPAPVPLPSQQVVKAEKVIKPEKVVKPEETDTLMDLVKESERSDDDGEPEWEVEIVPPIDIMKIMSIVSYLDGLPEVTRTEIIPRNDRTSVIVYTTETLELLDQIRGLSEVASAEETVASDSENDKLKKITLALSAKENHVETLIEDNVLHDAAK